MTTDVFDKLLRKAEKNVAALDRVDGHKDRSIGTIIAALECGLKSPDTNAQFDALVMLIDLRKEMHKRGEA